jgi:hypothetical protein
MSRWHLALCALAIAFVVSSPARADYTLVRWAWGDCKIWSSPPNNRPWGDDWTVLAWGLPTYDACSTTKSPEEIAAGSGLVKQRALVLRFRSSHHIAVSSIANFGIKGAPAAI